MDEGAGRRIGIFHHERKRLRSGGHPRPLQFGREIASRAGELGGNARSRFKGRTTHRHLLGARRRSGQNDSESYAGDEAATGATAEDAHKKGHGIELSSTKYSLIESAFPLFSPSPGASG